MSNEKLLDLYHKTGEKTHFQTIRERLEGNLRTFLERVLPSERQNEIPGLLHAAFQKVGAKRMEPGENYSVLGLLFQKAWRLAKAL